VLVQKLRFPQISENCCQLPVPVILATHSQHISALYTAYLHNYVDLKDVILFCHSFFHTSETDVYLWGKISTFNDF